MQICDAVPLVAILRGIRPDEIIAHSDTLVEQGFQFIEVPTNSPDWQTSIRLLQKQNYPSTVTIGAGTVVTLEKLNDLIAAQGKLMVTPNINPTIVRKSKQAGLLTCIGVMTPSEAFMAIEAGADILKLFPANVLGFSYIKAIKAVLPQEQPLYAVGGVTAENLAEFILAGCQGVGLGSDLYKKGQSPEQTRMKSKQYMDAWKRIAK